MVLYLMKKSTFQHLRFPFSFFLLPVFLFACGSVGVVDIPNTILAFVILHLVIYPASNGYNSYFDKDEKSIGGLKTPPKVTKQLYTYAIALDVLGLLLSLLISIEFTVMVFIYGLISKAYSHPAIRLKKKPIIGLLSVSIFQGYFIYLATVIAVSSHSIRDLMGMEWQFPAILATVLLIGSYPMTQVYQHEEDGKRGDKTVSLLLGVMGTFYFTAVFFTIAIACFTYYFLTVNGPITVIIFLITMLPTLGFFIWWFVRILKDKSQANHKYTMRLNLISSLSLNIFFMIFWAQNGLP